MDFNPEKYLKSINEHYKSLSMEAMEAFLLNLLKEAEDQYGRNTPGFGVLLNELGGYYRTVSKYPQAETAFLEAKTILETQLGRNNPNLGTTLNNLAGVYRLTGDHGKAEALFLEALDIYRQSGLSQSFAGASGYNNLGLLYLEQQNYSKAAQALENARVILANLKTHPVVYATSLGNLASAYIGLGKTLEAETMLKESISVYQTNQLTENLHYPAAINGLGQLYFSTGAWDKAEACFLQALELKKAYFGKDNHEFARAAENLSQVYEAKGQDDQAELYLRQALEGYRVVFGENSPQFQACQARLNRTDAPANSGPEGLLTTTITPNSPLQGQELSFLSFAQFCATRLCRDFPTYTGQIAAGLVGEGSECYGFDDRFSRDHDWGPEFCLWLSERDYPEIGFQLQQAYDQHIAQYEGFSYKDPFSGKRRGVFQISEFYKKYIGLEHPPVSLKEWMSIPESHLSVVTNGKVYLDESGEFTRFRKALLDYYPEDVRLKKLAARCAVMAQAGQYNYSRSLNRSEPVASAYALNAFTEAAISAVFLLNKQYMPFYKWMHRSMKDLPILGADLYPLLGALMSYETSSESKADTVERIAALIISELQRQALTVSSDSFLMTHAYEIHSRISDPGLKAMHIMAG